MPNLDEAKKEELKEAIGSILQGIVLAFTGELCEFKDLSLAVNMIYDGFEIVATMDT